MNSADKKLKRLIEIKRQLKLNDLKVMRVEKRMQELNAERAKILKSLTTDEKRLYKDRIIRACK